MLTWKSTLLLVSLPLVLTVTAWGQAATEYGLATSNSAAATSKVGTALQRATRPLTQGAATSVVTEKTKSPNSMAVRSAKTKPKPKPKHAQPSAQPATAAAVPTGGNGNALTISVSGGGKSSPGAKPGDKYKRQVQVSFEK